MEYKNQKLHRCSFTEGMGVKDLPEGYVFFCRHQFIRCYLINPAQEMEIIIRTKYGQSHPTKTLYFDGDEIMKPNQPIDPSLKQPTDVLMEAKEKGNLLWLENLIAFARKRKAMSLEESHATRQLYDWNVWIFVKQDGRNRREEHYFINLNYQDLEEVLPLESLKTGYGFMPE